jgi:hypothetical protein
LRPTKFIDKQSTLNNSNAWLWVIDQMSH